MEQLWSLTCVHMSTVKRVLMCLADKWWNWGQSLGKERLGSLYCEVDTKSQSLVNISIWMSQRHLKLKLNIFSRICTILFITTVYTNPPRQHGRQPRFLPSPVHAFPSTFHSHECFSNLFHLFLPSLPHQHCTNFSPHHFPFRGRQHHSFSYVLSYSIIF